MRNARAQASRANPNRQRQTARTQPAQRQTRPQPNPRGGLFGLPLLGQQASQGRKRDPSARGERQTGNRQKTGGFFQSRRRTSAETTFKMRLVGEKLLAKHRGNTATDPAHAGRTGGANLSRQVEKELEDFDALGLPEKGGKIPRLRENIELKQLIRAWLGREVRSKEQLAQKLAEIAEKKGIPFDMEIFEETLRIIYGQKEHIALTQAFKTMEREEHEQRRSAGKNRPAPRV